MPKYWKITNRSTDDNGYPVGGELGSLAFCISDEEKLDDPKNWNTLSFSEFKSLLSKAADQFPLLPHGANKDQKHITLFVHGFNNGAAGVADRYQHICKQLYDGPDGLGICICFDWPSLGSLIGYLPDREHALQCAGDLANILSELYDVLLVKQQDAVTAVKAATAGLTTAATPVPCKAKISIISHSMGNFLTQKALATVWTRKNQPLLVSLINQLVMVAADVSNDLFEPTSDESTDGTAMANLTYRITSLFTGRDDVLGASAGLKHFGTRRLGRSGLSKRPPTDKDNVWDIDCSGFFDSSVNGINAHGAYFETPGVYNLIRAILQGADRTVLDMTGATKGDAWPA